MARSAYQKLKPLYIMNYLLQNSDEDHLVSMSHLIEHLAAHGIPSERKSVYDDIEALRVFGLDIVQGGSGKNAGYYIANRSFELPELKLLVDSVQSSKFITHKKTATLIKKIETLASIQLAKADMMFFCSRTLLSRKLIGSTSRILMYRSSLK